MRGLLRRVRDPTHADGPGETAGHQAVPEEATRRRRLTARMAPLHFPPHPMAGAPPLHLLRVPAPETGERTLLEFPGPRTDVIDEPAAVMDCHDRLDGARCCPAPGPVLAVCAPERRKPLKNGLVVVSNAR